MYGLQLVSDPARRNFLISMNNPNTGFGDRGSFFSEHGGFRFQFKMSEMTAFHQHRITMR